MLFDVKWMLKKKYSAIYGRNYSNLKTGQPARTHLNPRSQVFRTVVQIDGRRDSKLDYTVSYTSVLKL